MTRARRSALPLALFVLGVLAASCSSRQSVLKPDLPPETSLFVQGPIDPVNHRVHLYWYGTDPDGEVVGFRYRWLTGPADPPWLPIGCGKPGLCTDSVFTLFTGDSAHIHAQFEIAAVDDHGLADPTPASQSFVLGNLPPVVTITNRLRLTDTTYASVTLKLEVNDPDGGGPGLHYRVWLDRNLAGADSTSDLGFTVPSARFLLNDTYGSGYRTVFVQAVDDGGSAGPVDTMSWYVRAPGDVQRDHRGRLLVIDDIPSTGQGNSIFDAFYQGALARLPAGSWSVLRPELNPSMFRSARDFAQTLRQFEAVLWYRGLGTTIAPLLQTYQDSLGAWLDSGGRLYLDGLYLVEGLNTPGALRSDFLARHLDSDYLYNNFNSNLSDSSAGWSNRGSARTGTFLRSSVYADTLRTLVSTPSIANTGPGIRGFGVRDSSEVALWAMDSQLDPPNIGFEVPVGVTVAQPNGGRIVLLSLPLRAGAPAPAGRILNGILYDSPIRLLPP